MVEGFRLSNQTPLTSIDRVGCISVILQEESGVRISVTDSKLKGNP
jgi:hypothetical protein